MLVTHGPPYGILDEIFPGRARKGDFHLLRRPDELAALRLHIFGDIHESHGVIDRVIGGRQVTFVNASINMGDYLNPVGERAESVASAVAHQNA